ncbi:hypothetical protein PIROE2DRAFT_4565 [Piromyces sp. E2]|nr:hypothetical protein PIROE2DRAFT_4565 [Piromyces sp. E2]|eukprot:OUM67886.1 hypothetical protein PIROE2DRAFT_4565 [Piromyces sp. E2]
MNPTPFKKGNSLCQKYTFIGIIYHFMILLLSCLIVVFTAFFEKANKYLFIILGLTMLYLTLNIVKTQPYYNKYVNNLRAGTWSMISGMSLINLISLLIGDSKPVFGIMFPIMGVLSFVCGIFICSISYKKKVKGIYRRFKEKRLSEKKRNNGGDESSSSSEKSGEERSQFSTENDEKLISIDSEDEYNDKKNEKKGYNESEEESESEEDDDYNSDKGSIVISDKISERITSFGSMHEILNEKIPNEPVIIYESSDDFELACRFIWNNETREAFQLVKELFDECISQFNKDPYVFAFYAYYLLYIEERTSKKNRDDIMGDIKNDINIDDDDDDDDKNKEKETEEEEEEGENNSNNNSTDNNSEEEEEEEEEEENKGKKKPAFLDEDKANASNPNYLLSKALTCKLNVFNKYFVRYLLYEIREKKKEDKDY